MFARGLLLSFFGLSQSTQGQTPISADFNGGNDTGWSHYAPLQTAPWNEQVTWTFPADSGGSAYHIFGGIPDISRDPATANNTGPARVGSYRSDSTYSDFFTAVDVVKWDDTIPANLGAIVFRANAPGFLTTFGYLAGYTSAQYPSASTTAIDQQGRFFFLEFQSELTTTELNVVKGGNGLVSRLNPARKYRIVATGTGGNLRAAIYDRTDLLEPIVQIGATNGDVPSGFSGVASVSYDQTGDDKPADFTFDNYNSSMTPASPVGFPGTPQVVELKPAPQTLFYSIPATNRITFAVQTFTTNQIATNALKMFLNGADVSSQLVLSNRAGILDPPKANFGVRYTGALASNTIYNGQIVVVDTAGKGTTNNFVFDTFLTNGTLIIEAEDYNYSSGQFQDDPPVSGLDPDGNQVNGFGVGYYGQVGTRDVDYYDTDNSPTTDQQQYRTGDGVGTFQNLFVGDTPRADHLATNVPDYAIWRMQAGEWLNYTRSFPSNNWNVYLRTSSQDREDVRYDEVTGDTTAPDQTKVLRGNFLAPNTGSSTRFRYVPLTDAAGNAQVLDFSGVRTFRITALGGFDSDRQHGGDDNGSLQPTYFLFMPATNSPSQRPWIALASPSANATDVLVQPTVQIIILDRTTSVSIGTIQLRFDGVNVTGSATITNTTTEGPGATVTYAPPNFLQPNSTHALSVVFSDGSITQSNQWSFTVVNLPVIPAGFRLLSGAGTNFSIQVSKAPNSFASSSNPGADGAAFVNSSYRAERQLANRLIQPTTLAPYTNEAANTPTNYGFYTEPVAINYERCGQSTGFFPGDNNFPGIYPTNYNCPADGPANFAMAATIKQSVAAGLYRMGVRSDDGFKVTVGTNATTTDLLLGIFEGGRGSLETTFDFVVTTNGVYNFRLLYWQGGGGADVEWYWINRATGDRELVRPLRLESSANVNGPYSVETAALIDPGAKTITVPKSGNARFYRLRSTTAYTINNPAFSGANVVLSYQ